VGAALLPGFLWILLLLLLTAARIVFMRTLSVL
jgi:hypothetical protein